MAEMKEQSITSELHDKEIANISDGEFKALVNQNAHWSDWAWSKKRKKEMRDTQSEIKQNIQGTNSERKETRTQSNNL